MWTHTVLELYPKPLRGNLPTEGEPADWIEQKIVYYAQGDDETVIYFTPLWRIVWIKIKQYVDVVDSAWINHLWSKTPWWKRQTEKFWAEMKEKTISTEELVELLEEDGISSDDLKDLLGEELL